MPEDINLLSSRRAYEFGPDELRLTVLSTPPVQQHIKQLFQFQVAVVGQPQATFGPVPATLPPGLVFDYGAWVSPDGTIVPIRFLHFEQRRIVLDVAGSSQVLDQIFTVLTKYLRTIATADGTPAIGTPQRTRDYSDVIAKLRVPLGAMLAPGVRDLLGRVMSADEGGNGGSVLTPFLAAQVQPRSDEYPGLVLPSPGALQLDLRAGTKPDDLIYFSTAPLDSEAHLRYLTDLETLLAR